ncbi:MAG: hypothetical protein PHV59_09710 [Victivallales bacterium]|nr:hypothetical protein [Victivallales bacterium]
MMNEQLLIADAIADRLKNNGYPEAERKLFITRKLKDYKTLKVTVVPLGYGLEFQNRAADDMTQTLQIGVQKLLAGNDPESEIEVLMDVERDIVKKLNRLTGISDLKAKVVGIENAPVFDALALQESNMFIGIITLTVRLLTPAEVQNA